MGHKRKAGMRYLLMPGLGEGGCKVASFSSEKPSEHEFQCTPTTGDQILTWIE